MPDWAAYARERLRLDDLRPERQAEIVEEIAGQLEQAYQEALQKGRSEQEAETVAAAHVADWDALSVALRESPIGRIPALDQLAERTAERDHARGGILGLFASVWRDVLYGLRLLGKNRGFAAAAILTMAIGIGANTAVFSIIDSTLFFALPYPKASRIVFAGDQSGSTFQNWAKHNGAFAAMSAQTVGDVTLTGKGEAERLRAGRVTAGFFRVLGVRPVLGRAFSPSETAPGGPNVAILSYALWRDRFGANPEIVGQTIQLNTKLYTIVGVMPESFQFPTPYATQPALLLPLIVYSSPVRIVNGVAEFAPVLFNMEVMGRLKPGVSMAAAQANLNVLLRAQNAHSHSFHAGGASVSVFSASESRLMAQAMGLGRGAHVTFVHSAVTLASLREYLLGQVNLAGHLMGGTREKELFVLWGAVGFLLLIACVNVANLALARAMAREREIAVRVALGAHRRRLARQLFTESVQLATLGGIAGIGVAYAAVVLVRDLGPSNIPRLAGATLDLQVLVFTAALTALSGILAGLAPARAAWRLSTVPALKEGGSTGLGRGHRRLRGALVVLEIAMALVLVIGAGLLARSFLLRTSIPLHFDPHNVLTAQIALPQPDSANAPRRIPLSQGPGALVASFMKSNESADPILETRVEGSLLARVSSLPGVVSVGATDRMPDERPANSSSLQFAGEPMPGGVPSSSAADIAVSPGFFRTLGIHVLQGRDFQPSDDAATAPVAIVNEAFVRSYFPDIDALGQKINQGEIRMVHGRNSPDTRWTTIVGVVTNLNADGDIPIVYRPFAQRPTSTFALFVRTTGNPLALVPAVRTQVAQVDSDLPVFDVATMDHLLSEQVATPRFNTALLTAFALIALVLAALGVYGVISYAVSEQTHEIGIRMALGAEKSSVLRMIVSKTLILALVGIGIGIGGALALTRYLRSLLYQIRPDDPWSFAIAAVVLLVAALLAGFVPARRATKIDPLTALRYE